ncbi:MAG: DUF1214 domain-containing protein [Deltaproteobacteria bacterium]|nr:DUF1214 domain-containing protein [Deltaproteobacteria bacterium]
MTQPTPPRLVPDLETWSAFCRHTENAARLVLAAAPDDPFDRAEGLRYVGRIAQHGLQSFIEESDPAHPVVTHSLPKLGGDNPDYVYSVAALSGACEYRLRGRLGDSSYLGLGTYHGGVGTAQGLQVSGYLAGKDMSFDGDGRFEITLACEKRPGNWLPMKPETSQLMIRELLLDRRNQRSATFSIERIGAATPSHAADYAAFHASQMARAGAYVEGAITQFLEWTKDFASRPNRIDRLDERLASGARGDPFTHYYSGYYAIAPDEAMIAELTPPACEYWNLQLCNHWLESLDFTRHTVSVNHASAVKQSDGSVRIVIAHADPGVPNWLDTAGHRRGCIILRQVGTATPDDPRCRVVKLRDVARA